MQERYRLAIIGSGPAGLSAAARAASLDAEAGRAAPSHVLLESFDGPSKTVYRFQKRKHVMAEPGYLKLRSDLSFEAGLREDVLARWDDGIRDNGINLRTNSEVTAIRGTAGQFELDLSDGTVVEAETVVLAIGVQGNPRRLEVEGDTPENVQYQLDDPDAFRDQHIVVVGAGDAAIENAVALAAHNRVTILNRRDEFARVKDANQMLILNAISDAKTNIDCRYATTVARINRNEDRISLTLDTPNGEETIQADRVIARLGAVPQRRFLEACGIELPHDGADALPSLSDRYESNVPGIFVVGALAGYPLIKQALNQGYDVVEFIAGNPITPIENELLSYQFHGLPYELGVDELAKLMMSRIPMFRQLNVLAFRELVIESSLYACYSDPDSASEAARSMRKLADAVEQEYASATTPKSTHVIEEGRSFYSEGDRADSFFTVLDGEVILASPTSPTQGRTLLRGEFFGETSLISGQPRRESARAGRNCIVMETPRRTIVKLMNSNDVVRAGINWIFTVRELQRHFAPTTSLSKLREFADEVVEHTYSAGEVLWRAEDPANSVHIVRNGTVALSRGSAGAASAVVAQVRAGDLVGQSAVLGSSAREETATAAVASETLEVSEALVGKLMALDESQWVSVREKAARGLVERSIWETHPDSRGLLNFLLDDGLGEATNALVIDETLCIGCDNCESACAGTHNGISRLKRSAGVSFASMHVPIACRHCAQPHCMKDCPPNAINRASTGEVFIDDTCIGCGNCVVNCPYDVIQLEASNDRQPSLLRWMLFGAKPNPADASGAEATKAKRAVKCDACIDLTGGPACVAACPTGAAFRLGPDPVTALVEGRS